MGFYCLKFRRNEFSYLSRAELLKIIAGILASGFESTILAINRLQVLLLLENTITGEMGFRVNIPVGQKRFNIMKGSVENPRHSPVEICCGIQIKRGNKSFIMLSLMKMIVSCRHRTSYVRV